MDADAAVVIALDDVEGGERRHRPGFEPGLLAELAYRRLEDRLAEFLDAAGKAPFADARRAGALHQQHAPVAPDDTENAHDRPVGIVAGIGGHHREGSADRPACLL